MSEFLTVSLEELQQAANLIFARLKRDGRLRFELGVDYYWDFSRDARYNPHDEPEPNGLGQLSFDVENLREMASSGLFPSDYALRVLATILRAIGETCDV
jgi:hypothetical protein